MTRPHVTLLNGTEGYRDDLTGDAVRHPDAKPGGKPGPPLGCDFKSHPYHIRPKAIRVPVRGVSVFAGRGWTYRTHPETHVLFNLSDRSTRRRLTPKPQRGRVPVRRGSAFGSTSPTFIVPIAERTVYNRPTKESGRPIMLPGPETDYLP